MAEQFPGPKTRAALERGIPLFRNGLRFEEEMQKAAGGLPIFGGPGGE